jgi:methyl-accepting chemotaxis protein
LDSVIQQNASASEEMASTAEELSGQSEQLEEMVSFFKMKEHEYARVAKRNEVSRNLKVEQIPDNSFNSQPVEEAQYKMGASCDETVDEFEQF